MERLTTLFRLLFYIAATIALYKVATNDIKVVNTTVVGFVEACQWHNGQLVFEYQKVICLYPDEVPTLQKITK